MRSDSILTPLARTAQTFFAIFGLAIEQYITALSCGGYTEWESSSPERATRFDSLAAVVKFIQDQEGRRRGLGPIRIDRITITPGETKYVEVPLWEALRDGLPLVLKDTDDSHDGLLYAVDYDDAGCREGMTADIGRTPTFATRDAALELLARRSTWVYGKDDLVIVGRRQITTDGTVTVEEVK
jgi:hypothetical protein